MEPPEDTNPLPEASNKRVSGDPSLSSSMTTPRKASTEPKNSRKRTKTGCLTCRMRRIKCGEEQPICKNCIKSKRNCPGYPQRVVFKHPVGGYPQGRFENAQPGRYSLMPQADVHSQEYASYSTSPAPLAPLPPIAPRPFYSETNPSGPSNIHRGTDPNLFQNTGPYGYSDNTLSLGQPPHTPVSLDWAPPRQMSQENVRRASLPALNSAILSTDSTSSTVHHRDDSYTSRSYGRTGAEENAILSRGQSFDSHGQGDRIVPSTLRTTASEESLRQQYGYVPEPKVKVEPLNAVHTWKDSGSGRRFSVEGFVQHTSFDTKIPTQPVHHVAPEDGEHLMEDADDFFDVESDEDQDPKPPERSDLGLMLALSASQDERRARSFTTFLHEPNVLATYRPAASASPLMDPQTARIFCHFVTSTGPSLSIYERHPSNPSIMFNGFPVPPSQQALWTYTLPMMALGNQALLHSMLALASLHIAKLQQTSPTPSLKHYHFALRRVSKAVGLPQRRLEIETLAATLLLGFYEVMTAEHSKWSSHLLGAKQLIMEIDFSGMTQRVHALKAEISSGERDHHMSGYDAMGFSKPSSDADAYGGLLPDKEFEIDSGFISTLSGYSVDYNQYGSVFDGMANESLNRLTIKDLENYKIHKDLFWWFLKQDCFQAMVSGNRLLMPYDRWVHCPPRASFGRLDSIYATMDHAILLMGRIADFAGKDQKRKKRLADKNGGHWRPPPGFKIPGMQRPPGPSRPTTDSQGPPPQGQSTAAEPSQPKSQPPPMMKGMVPAPDQPARMPDAFSPDGGPVSGDSPTDSLPDHVDDDEEELAAQTQEALTEWQAIDHALKVFRTSLPPEFQPLRAEYAQPIHTPFGPALQYRTLTQSCTWIFHLTGRILHQRTHPHMPPAAMMAVGVAAALTAEDANLIGRVCAGIYPQDRTTSTMNPTLGAALIESTMGLFFAGVQFMDPAQRGWTITKLRDIARLTGWQSSATIAAGCEIAWEQAGLAGRGPPYQRTMDPRARDERVAGRRSENREIMPGDHNDRRFIVANPGTRVHWALGILSVEEDVKKLDLDR